MCMTAFGSVTRKLRALVLPFLTITGLHLGLCLVNVAEAQTKQWAWRFVKIDQPTTGTLVATGPATLFSTKVEAAAAMRAAASPGSQVLTEEIGSTASSSTSRILYRYMTPRVDPTITPWGYGVGPVFDNEEDYVAWLRPRYGLGEDCPTAQLVMPVDWTPEDPNPWGATREYKTYQYTGACAIPQTSGLIIRRYREFSCPIGYQGMYSTPPFCGSGLVGYVEGPLVECPDTGPSGFEGNPCNVVTGEKYESETDYASHALRFVRHYHSIALPEGSAIGVGWTHNYANFLAVSGGIPRLRVRADGFQEVLYSSSGAYLSRAGSGVRVTAGDREL